jgi:hypothetical protein
MCLLVGLDQSSRAMRRSSRLSWSSIVVTSLLEVGIPVQHHSRGRPASSNDISCHKTRKHVNISRQDVLRLVVALLVTSCHSLVSVSRLTSQPCILIASLVSRYRRLQHIQNIIYHQAKAHCGVAMNNCLDVSTQAMKRMRPYSLPHNIPTSLITPIRYTYASV